MYVIPRASVEAVFNGDVVRAGNSKWTRTDGDPVVENLKY
jgi:hypothetical protein